VSARALKTQKTHDQQTSTSKAKNIDNARAHLAKAWFAPPTPLQSFARDRADTHRQLVADRRKEKAERRRKRNRPVKNPWSDERKAAARLKRAGKIAEASNLVCKPVAARTRLGLPEPTPKQKEMAFVDYLKWIRDLRIKRGEISEDDDQPWADNAQYNRDHAADGFIGNADELACGKYPVGPFEERTLRSEAGLDSDPLFFVMATSTPKAGRRRSLPQGGADYQRLRAGRTKSERPIMWGKMQALHQDYIDTLDVMWTWICTDLDQNFASEDALRKHVRAKVRRGRLACEPTFVVCALGEDDELLRPHLWWKLPDGLEVYNDPKKKSCRRAPRRLYDGVATGICVELEDLGADAAHLGNPRGGKNPCCPRLHTFVWNVDVFPTLEQWSRHVCIWHKRDHVVREQVIRSADMPGPMSNEVFTQASSAAWRLLRVANDAGLTIDDVRDRELKLFNDLRDEFARRDFGPNVTDADVGSVLSTVAKWVAEKWAPWKTGPQVNRGRAYDLVRAIPCRDVNGKPIPEGITKRQRIGGKVGPAVKMAKTLDMIVTAMEYLAQAGHTLSLANVIPLVDRGQRCVRDNWNRAQKIYFNGENPTEFSCLIGGKDQSGENIKPLFYTDLRERPAGVLTETAIKFWPGGFDDCSPYREVGTAELDTCSISTDVGLHGAGSAGDQPAERFTSSPAEAKADQPSAGWADAFAEERDEAHLQRNLQAESDQEWLPDETGAWGGDDAGDDRGDDGIVAGGCEADYGTGSVDPEVGRGQERGTDIQGRRDQVGDRKDRGGDAAAAARAAITRERKLKIEQILRPNMARFPMCGAGVRDTAAPAAGVRESRPQPAPVKPATSYPTWLVARSYPEDARRLAAIRCVKSDA
jgi:hypothetical protein